MIMGEKILDCKAICKLPFGAYVQVPEDQQVTNTMKPRTTGAIALGPSNMNGGYKFFHIITGEILVRRQWVELPIPNEVILKQEEFSTYSNDGVNIILTDDVEEEEDIPIMEDTEVERENHPIVLETEYTTGNSLKEDDLFKDKIIEEENGNDDAIIKDEQEIEINEMEVTLNDNKENEVLSNDNKESEELGQRKPTGSQYNLRPNRELSYNHKYSFLLVHASINKWGETTKEAVREELRMFKKEGVFEKVEIPTKQQKRKALMIPCFVIEKRDGRIKARAVADGRSQQSYTEE
jgi:hypothetical protein